jgi:hypothetical protein
MKEESRNPQGPRYSEAFHGEETKVPYQGDLIWERRTRELINNMAQG